MQVQAVTLEAERDAIHAEDTRLNEQRRAQAERIQRLYLRWAMLYPQSSRREFITWVGYGEYHSRLYAYLWAGQALMSGFTDPTYRLGDLDQIGRALSDGSTPADIRQRLSDGQPARLPQRDVTTIQIPSALAGEIRAAVAQVSDSDKLGSPEAAARIIESYAAQQPALRDALRDTSATGRSLTAALVAQPRPDYRAELKEHGRCLICGVRPVELHHIRTDFDERSRSNERVIPLCTRHHAARPGDDTDSIHARPLESYRDDAAFWRSAFEAVADAAEATRQGER